MLDDGWHPILRAYGTRGHRVLGPRCAVQVPDWFSRPAWRREMTLCGRRTVAWDATNADRVSYLYGTCAGHLTDALAADPALTWIWVDGRPVDPENLDAEIAVLTLGARYRHPERG